MRVCLGKKKDPPVLWGRVKVSNYRIRYIGFCTCDNCKRLFFESQVFTKVFYQTLILGKKISAEFVDKVKNSSRRVLKKFPALT